MKATTNNTPCRPAIGVAALVAALALAGCGSDNVGESWQCPLAQGGSCTSVAAADPAVPAAGGRTMLGEPLWKPRIGASGLPLESVCTSGCGDGSGPFAWLGRLLGGDGDRDDGRDAGPGTERDSGPGTEAGPPEIAASALADPASGTLPAGAAPGRNDAEASGPYDARPNESDPVVDGLSIDDSRGDGIRTGEVVARIWIAPFVDGNGVYREAGHVRVVLAPAGWRTE